MRIRPAILGPALRGIAVALVLGGAAGASVAGPETGTDPILGLIVDKGLLADAAPAPDATTPEPGLLRRVGDRASDLTMAAMGLVGVRYQRGGSSAATGFDCSGFTRHVFEMSLGLVLPRRADDQAAASGLVAVRREDLKPGDLVFFNTLRRTFSHVGIYIGDGKFIHSPKPGQTVRTESLGFAYWAKRFTGARRADLTLANGAASVEPAPSGGS